MTRMKARGALIVFLGSFVPLFYVTQQDWHCAVIAGIVSLIYIFVGK